MAGVRSDPRYQRARKAYLAEARALGLPCASCGRPIDYDMPWDQADSVAYPTVNHRVPLAQGGDPFDPEGFEPMHYGCNSSLGAGERASAPPSRQW